MRNTLSRSVVPFSYSDVVDSIVRSYPGCVAVCQALEHDDKMVSLDLAGNDIRAEGTRALASLFRVHTSLRM